MNNTKIYTVQELRKVANIFFCGRGHDLLDGGLTLYKISKEGLAEMLRQAADMRERCEGLLARLRPYRDEDIIDTINYILRGDAGKEEK